MSWASLLLVESEKSHSWGAPYSMTEGYFQQELAMNGIPVLSLQLREDYTHSAHGAPKA